MFGSFERCGWGGSGLGPGFLSVSGNKKLKTRIISWRKGAKMNTQKGFTLVELAIVLTIIGLLIGGILKGQQLMVNSRITATLAQVKALEAATTTFRDSYGGMPGDIISAANKVPGCNAACDVSTGTGPGNGIVGLSNWNMGTSQNTPLATSGTPLGTATLVEQFETLLFWTELNGAGLITGVNNAALSTGSVTIGAHVPSARIGGGFLVGYSSGATAIAALVPPRPAGSATLPVGTVLVLAPTPADLTANAGANVLTPTQAAQMDRKIDDGLPQSGTVEYFGSSGATGCVPAAGPFTYIESVQSKECGLYFQVQG